MTPTPRSPLRVFVADDEHDLRALVVSLLRGEGFIVREAANGKELLTLIDEEFQPNLMITDLHMPGVSGLEVLSHMQRHHPGVPVILMTGFATNFLHEQAVGKGAAAVLRKPFSITMLLELVAQHVPQATSGARKVPEKSATRSVLGLDSSANSHDAGRPACGSDGE